MNHFNFKHFRKICKKHNVNILEFFFESCLEIISLELKSPSSSLKKYIENNVFNKKEDVKELIENLFNFHNYIVSFLSEDLINSSLLENFVKELTKGLSNEKVKEILEKYYDKFIVQAMKDYQITTEIINEVNDKDFLYEIKKGEIDADKKVAIIVSALMHYNDIISIEKNITLIKLRDLCMEFIKAISTLNFIRMNKMRNLL